MDLLIFFIVLNVFNVIIQTIKSLVTVKGGKFSASIINALTYGVYTVVLVYMNCDLPLWAKVATVAGSNLIGVYIVKWLEEKAEKFKIRKIEITIKDNVNGIIDIIQKLNISSNTGEFTNIKTGETNYIINCFCYSKEELKQINNIIKKYNLKYFINISK